MDSDYDMTAAPATLTRSSPSTRAIDASPKPRRKLLAALRKPTAESSESETESDNDAPVSVDDATTQAPTTQTSTESRRYTIVADDEESDAEAAYERMKKRLAARKNPAESQKVQKELVVATVVSSEEDEMPVRVATRKNIPRKSGTTSPPSSRSPSIRSRPSSPGLFVTPNASPAAKKQSRTLVDAGSGSDDSTQPSHSADLQERVRRIRAERLVKQQEEEAQQAKPKKIARRRVDQGSGSDTDGENGRRLTQQAKPTRKAGKKALEAMARDQQRISRNMQLTHQAKTKKRYSTKDLLIRMGFNVPTDEAVALPTPEASSAVASSDVEANQIQDTPPTSPPREEGTPEKDVLPTLLATPSVEGAEQHQHQSPMSTKLEKGKGRAPEFQHLPQHPWMQAEPVIVQKIGIDTMKPADDVMVELSDSDDEPQVVQPKSRFPVFDRMPTKKQHESASLLHLRSLAQLARSPQKGKKGQKSVTLAEMEFSLAQKARQQANKEREEKIAELKQRGHTIETEEERERHQMEIEDMVAQFEKQRQEDLKLAKLERDEAKKNGETIDDLPSSDESDGDYVGSGEESANEEEGHNELEPEIELELSGSEEEDLEDAEDAEEEESADNSNGLIHDMADEDDESEEAPQMQQIEEDADMEDEDMKAPMRTRTINRARNRVVDDEDESDTDAPGKLSLSQEAPQDDAMAAFGFGNTNVGAGLTQMFAGTMANLESGSQSTQAINPEPEQDSLDFLRSLPDTQPGANFSQASEFMVPNSQSFMSPQKESQTGAESQFSLGISQLIKTSPAFSRTQLEDFEPTQDAGFSFSRSPAGLIPPPSTADTVMMPITESPIKQRKGKLQRGRKEEMIELSDVEEDILGVGEEASDEDDIQRPPKPRNAFSKMKNGAQKQKAIDDFNKKTSMAKDAVMEQAEESEDEYAGLGGASDDEEGEEDQELKDMIDHNDVNVDERQIAAFYADKAKKEDEKNIADLYKKIQTGGLRRQAGGRDGFDMSDSEDEAEARQRKKRAEFQKMSKELLKDERVKKIADDEKKKAFFNTLADFADEADYEFLDMPAEVDVQVDTSQSQEGLQANGLEDVIPDSQAADATSMPAPMNPLKRKSPDSQKENRPPPHLRRTAASDNLTRKPITLADVQNSVSELLEDPRIIVPDSQYSESEDDDESPVQNAASRKPIVDRLTLSRTPSISEAIGADATMAFHAPSRASAAPGFRVPSLIRRATSNLSTTSQTSSGANTPTESAVRRGGTGRSNIHAQAREAERRALLEKKDGKRKEALRKKVEGGRKRAGGMRSVLGDLGGGFE
ncbi:Nn.00g047060.m01.CDS01 [Neocucurbitaria sp. VM-36]